MSLHYRCPKCGKYFAERAPHPACDAAPTDLVGEHYLSQDELPTNFDRLNCWLLLAVYVAMGIVCWNVSPWLVTVPIVLNLAHQLCLRSIVRVCKSAGFVIE